MNANYRGMSQYPEEYSGYGQGGNNMQAVGFHQGSYDGANMGMMTAMGGSGGGGGGSGTYPMPGYDSSQSHMMGQQQQMALYQQQQQQQQQAAAYMAQQQQQQQQYYSGSGSTGTSGAQYGGQSYAVQGSTAAGNMAMGGGASPYYSAGTQGQAGGGGGGGGRMVPPPHHHLRNTSGQQNPQVVADNILQMASCLPSHHTVQVPLKNRHAPYQIPRSPQNYYPDKCGGPQQGLGSQGAQQGMLTAQAQQQGMLSAQPGQQGMLTTQAQQQAMITTQAQQQAMQSAQSAHQSMHSAQSPQHGMHGAQGTPHSMHSAQSPQHTMHSGPTQQQAMQTMLGQGQLQPKVSQPSVSQSPAMLYTGSPHSQLQHSSPSSPHMMQSPQAPQAHQSIASPGALSSPSSAAVCSPVPSSPGLGGMRSPGSMPMRSPAHLSSGYPSQTISSPPHRPYPAPDPSVAAQHCSPPAMHSPASHSSSPYALGMAQHVNSPPQQPLSFSVSGQNACKVNMLMDSGQGPGGQRGAGGSGQGSDPLQSLQKLVMLPETQVVDPKSVVNDGCLHNSEDGSKNFEGPAEQSREAEGCSAGVSVNCSPPTADAHSTSTAPSQEPQEVSAESAQSSSRDPPQEVSNEFAHSTSTAPPQEPQEVSAECAHSSYRDPPQKVSAECAQSSSRDPPQEVSAECAQSSSTDSPQEVAVECAAVSQEEASLANSSPNHTHSTQGPPASQNSPTFINEKDCEKPASLSPAKPQCSSSSRNSDQSVCSTSPQAISDSKPDALTDTPSTGKPQSQIESCQVESVVPCAQSENPHSEVENNPQSDGCSSDGLKNQAESPGVCNGPAEEIESSNQVEAKQPTEKSNITGASVEPDSQKVASEVATDIKEVQCNTLKPGDCPGATQPSPPKQRHSQRLRTLATRSYKSLNEGSLAYFDLDSRFGMYKKDVQSSNPKPSPPKKRQSHRQSQSTTPKSTSPKVSLLKGTDSHDTEGSNSVIAGTKHKSCSSGKQKLVNGFDDKHTSPPAEVVRTVPQNHIQKQQSNRCSEAAHSSVKDAVVSKGKAGSKTASSLTRSAGIVNGPKDGGLLMLSRKADSDTSSQQTGLSSGCGPDSTPLQTAKDMDSVSNHHSLSGGEEDSFSSELDFGYDSPPFEMQDDSWKPELERGAANSGEDEADGNGDSAVNSSVQKPHLSSKDVTQSSPSKATLLMTTRSVTRSITGHARPKRKAEETEYTANYKRTRRSLALSGQPNSMPLSVECEDIDTRDTKDTCSDVEVISSDDESLSVQNVQYKSSPSVYIPANGDKNKHTPNSSKKKAPKNNAQNQNKQSKSKSSSSSSPSKTSPNFYSVRGVGGRFISRSDASLSPGSVKADPSSQPSHVSEQSSPKDSEGGKGAEPVRETRRLRNRSGQPSVTDPLFVVTDTPSKPNHANNDNAVRGFHTSPPHHKPSILRTLPSAHQGCSKDTHVFHNSGDSKLDGCLAAAKNKGGNKPLECLTETNACSQKIDRPLHENLTEQKGAIKRDAGGPSHGWLSNRISISKTSEDRSALNNFSDRKSALKTGEAGKFQNSLSIKESPGKNTSRPSHQHFADRIGAMKTDVSTPSENFWGSTFASHNSNARPGSLPDKKEVTAPLKKSTPKKDEEGLVQKPKKVKKQVKGNKKKKCFIDIETVDDSFKTMKFSKTLDHLQNNKKDKSQSAKMFLPFVRVKGQRSTPSSVSVFNAPPLEGKHAKSAKMKGATCAAGAGSSVQITHFSSDKSVMVPWSKTTDAPWVCGLCGMRSSYRFLGDLFGPYFLDSHISALQKFTAEGVKKEGRHDNAAGSWEGGNSHNTRRKSVSQSRSQSTEETAVVQPVPQEVWVHEDCVLWSTGVCVVGTRIHGLEEALSASASALCAGCQQKGALIGCLHKGCNQTFHYICAVDKMCFLDVENFSMLCPKHKDKRIKSAAASTSKS